MRALQCALDPRARRDARALVALGAGGTEADALRLADLYRRRGARPRGGGRDDRAVAAPALGHPRDARPSPSFDAMVNRWSLYQALACRMWARSALYQSSGAYGFRDQLQDVMAFLYAEPGVARAHILRAAAPPVRRGRRAALVASAERARRAHALLRRSRVAAVRRRSVRRASPATRRVLDEVVPFITMRQLAPNEHEIYDLPQVERRAGDRVRALPARAAQGVARRARTVCR